MTKTRHSLAFKVRVPPDFVKALRDRPVALKVFQAVPLSHQRRYIEYIYEAKKEETRRLRMTKTVRMILAWDAGQKKA